MTKNKKNSNRFANPKMCLWALSNPWYINDMKLTLAGMRIHENLKKGGSVIKLMPIGYSLSLTYINKTRMIF